VALIATARAPLDVATPMVKPTWRHPAVVTRRTLCRSPIVSLGSVGDRRKTHPVWELNRGINTRHSGGHLAPARLADRAHRYELTRRPGSTGSCDIRECWRKEPTMPRFQSRLHGTRYTRFDRRLTDSSRDIPEHWPRRGL
jgi:hypothetical protein